MIAVAILNVVLAVLVVAAILSLLGWGIVKDKASATSISRGPRGLAPRRTPRPARTSASDGLANRRVYRYGHE
jgi:hypothetical protein